MNNPEISVVIRTFNEEKFLPDLLATIEQQAYRDHETIVVDSGSMDRTREIAVQKANKLLSIESRDFTFGHFLNAGIQKSSCKYIVIVSTHTLPFNEYWLGNLIKPLHDDTTTMVYGRQLGGRSSNYSEAQDMRRTFGKQRRVSRPSRFFANNANSAVRKDLWRQHPFDEGLLGLEDIEWAKYWMKRHYQVVYEPQAALYHIHAENWLQIRRRYYREAVIRMRWIPFFTRVRPDPEFSCWVCLMPTVDIRLIILSLMTKCWSVWWVVRPSISTWRPHCFLKLTPMYSWKKYFRCPGLKKPGKLQVAENI